MHLCVDMQTVDMWRLCAHADCVHMQTTFYTPSRPCCYHTDKASSSSPYRELACLMQRGRKPARGLQGTHVTRRPRSSGAAPYLTTGLRVAMAPPLHRGTQHAARASRRPHIRPADFSARQERRRLSGLRSSAQAAYTDRPEDRAASARRPPRGLSWLAATRMLTRMATWMAARHGLRAQCCAELPGQPATGEQGRETSGREGHETERPFRPARPRGRRPSDVMRELRVTRLLSQFGVCSKAGGCAAWRTRHWGQDEGPLSSWGRGAFHGGLRTAGTAQTNWSKKKPRSNQENLFSGVL